MISNNFKLQTLHPSQTTYIGSKDGGWQLVSTGSGGSMAAREEKKGIILSLGMELLFLMSLFSCPLLILSLYLAASNIAIALESRTMGL